MKRVVYLGVAAAAAIGLTAGVSCHKAPLAPPAVASPTAPSAPEPTAREAIIDPPRGTWSPNAKASPDGKGKLFYTTYFYTAAEAIIHGYEPDTSVKIVALDKNATVYQGKLGPGETALVSTGKGVFGFLADKKASILVGTPSSCTAVGYFVKNREGSFRSGQFYARLPSSVSAAGAKVVVWAWEETPFSIHDVSTKERLHQGTIKPAEPFVMDAKELEALGNHVLDVRGEKPALSVEVYYDEGFVVPSRDGRAAGKEFYTYVGDITTGLNDLLLTAYSTPARVKVTDIKTHEPIWEGTVEENQLHPITMKNRFVKVTSNVEINVTVAAYKHHTGIYAEHHFGMGAEGTGIENRFLIHSPEELWIFSYFGDSDVEVVNGVSHEPVWKGRLQPGQVQGLKPGFGFYQVRSSKGVSVMGGSSSCGGEYSPAAGMFAVDDALYQVMIEIQAARKEQAAREGHELSPAASAAPLSTEEMSKARAAVKARTNRESSFSADEIQQRIDTMQKK